MCLGQVLHERGSALRKAERSLQASPAASSCLTLLKHGMCVQFLELARLSTYLVIGFCAAESTLVRAISRAVDDAVIVAMSGEAISEMASEVVVDYFDPVPWEAGAGTIPCVRVLFESNASSIQSLPWRAVIFY